ncbi:hypothetical protein PROFUN_11681 [Planoprotostelium fungivorum]|uniref:Uncharacterized protein n=1 Tax=Planoprotostelium fungivorum TaxID=1890364 RepID=A0A2P6N596_9EUKA|nr:hypothetical protein PROFUN_11681 [Planoprotostelium fungivorum]
MNWISSSTTGVQAFCRRSITPPPLNAHAVRYREYSGKLDTPAQQQRGLAIPHSLFLCTIMKSLSLLLFACLLAVASARPAAFRNAVPVDGTGTRRLVEESGDHIVSRSVKFFPQVVLLDEVHELLSITCYGADRLVLVFNDSIPSWTSNFPVLGGIEWGCVDDAGEAISPSLYVLNITSQGNTVEITGRKPAMEEVYEHFKIEFTRNEDTKRSTGTVTGSFNYDYANDRAISTIPILHQDCQSRNLSPKAQEFCQLNGKLSNDITCTNCFAHTSVTLIAELNGDELKFGLSGSLTLHSEFDLTIPAEVIKEFDIMSKTIAITHIPSFLGISIQGYLDVRLTALVAWQNQGTLHSGFDMNVNYGWNSEDWSPYNNHRFQLIKPTGSQGGEARFRLTFTIGPGFKLKALWTTAVDTSITFNPWIEADVGFAVSQPFPALSNIPSASDSIIYDPSFVSACRTDHYLNFKIPFGYQTIFMLKGWAVSDRNVPLQDYVSSKPLAQGCLLPASSRIIKQIQFLFDGSIAGMNVTNQAFVSLFRQDLLSIIGDSSSISGITTSLLLNRGGKVEVGVILAQGSDFPETDSTYAQLARLSRDPSSIRDDFRASRVSQFLVANIPPSTTTTTAYVDGTYNLLPSSTAVSRSVFTFTLVVTLILAAFSSFGLFERLADTVWSGLKTYATNVWKDERSGFRIQCVLLDATEMGPAHRQNIYTINACRSVLLPKMLLLSGVWLCSLTELCVDSLSNSGGERNYL